MTAQPRSQARQYTDVAVLAAAQAFFMSTQLMGIATIPLAAKAMLGPETLLATLPMSLSHAGVMIATFPASLLMARIGRRAGFSVGAMFAILSGITSYTAVGVQSFPLLCLGALLQGGAAGFAFYYRFAAADAASPDFRPTAISLVLAGGILAPFLGGETAKRAVEWLPVTFAGVFVMVSLFGALILLVVQFLRIPPLTLAERQAGGRPLAEIARQPAFVVAVMAAMFGYGIMSLLMTATPLAMSLCGFDFKSSTTVIQWHALGMFVPSFFTGHLIRRFGAPRIIVAGALLLAICAMIDLAGQSFWNFFFGLLLLGIGWNFAYIGGTTLLTTTYLPAERARVQAFNDFLVYAVTATTSGLAGVLQAQVGWNVVNIASLPLMLLIAFAAWRNLDAGRAQPAGGSR